MLNEVNEYFCNKESDFSRRLTDLKYIKGCLKDYKDLDSLNKNPNLDI